MGKKRAEKAFPGFSKKTWRSLTYDYRDHPEKFGEFLGQIFSEKDLEKLVAGLAAKIDEKAAKRVAVAAD